jgi:hypothetical protein
MPVTVNGTAGVDAPGLAISGDPVVESGSNANGGWVRLADGTQVCWHLLTLAYSGTKSILATWTFPVAFIADPQVTTTELLGGTIGFSAATKRNTSYFYFDNRTASSIRLNYYNETAAPFVSGDTMLRSAIAIGRWKA